MNDRTPVVIGVLALAGLAFSALLVLSVRPGAAPATAADRHADAEPSKALPDWGEVPEFLLVEKSGELLRRSDLDGKVWVCAFIFTNCPYPCPLMTAEMARLQEEFLDAPDFRLVSFSVDPGRDTPEVLEAYARRYGAKEGRWFFATGKVEELMRIQKKGFRLAAGAKPVEHSVRFVLVDRDLRIRGTYNVTDKEAVGRMRADVRQLLARP